MSGWGEKRGEINASVWRSRNSQHESAGLPATTIYSTPAGCSGYPIQLRVFLFSFRRFLFSFSSQLKEKRKRHK